MSGPFAEAAIFLVETLFGLYIMIVMLRFLLALFRGDFYNPVSQFLVKATQPVLRPLRRFIPGYRGVDMPAIVLLFGLQLAEVWLVSQIHGSAAPPLSSAVAVTLVLLLKGFVDIFFYAVIIRIILSWVSPQGANPVMTVLNALTEPLMRPARRLFPALSLGGMDLSPMLVLIGLHLCTLLVVRPLMRAALSTFGVG